MAQTNDEVVHREMYERTRDIIRVRNPLDIDYRFKIDSVWYKVPAKGEKDFERWIVSKYFHDISTFIIGQMSMEKGKALLEERRKNGMADFLNKYDENRAIWDNVPRTDNKELLDHLAEDIIVGLVEKFGEEEAPPETQKLENRTIPVEQQSMDSFADRKVVDTLPQKPIIESLKKKVSAQDVTVE